MKLFRKLPDPVAAALEEAGLTSDEASRLATAGTPIAVRPGVQLCREGDFGLEAFVLVTGELVVRVDGKDHRKVAAGEVIGEIAALDPQRRRTATVETTQDSVVLAYDVRTFRALAAEMSDLLVPERAA